jgi:hypothetical protein
MRGSDTKPGPRTPTRYGTTWTTVWRQTSGSISDTPLRIPIPDAAPADT